MLFCLFVQSILNSFTYRSQLVKMLPSFSLLAALWAPALATPWSYFQHRQKNSSSVPNSTDWFQEFPGFENTKTISRDVCIVGGGSSGTYAAVRLKDMNQSVVVIERNDYLGGHTHTYRDPNSGETDDYGVIIWHNLTLVRRYFDRFNVSLEYISQEASSAVEGSLLVDFTAGQTVTNITSPDPTAALEAYEAQLVKYPFLNQGYYLPSPVPQDLLLPFSDFVQKYDLSAMVSTAFQYNQGQGDILSMSTLYTMKLFGADILQNLATGGFLTTAHHDNSALYSNAAAYIGTDNILLNTTVAFAIRPPANSTNGRTLLLTTSTDGTNSLLSCGKMLITIPPITDTLTPFILDGHEYSVLAPFKARGYYTGILSNAVLPPNITQITAASASNEYGLPDFPTIYYLSSTRIPGLTDVKYGSNTPLSDDEVQSNIIHDVQKLASADIIFSAQTPDFVAFKSHAPFELYVEAEDIESGFYDNLYGLQGYRGTWWTGAAWHVQDSSLLWNFTEYEVLPKMMGST